MEFYEHLRDRTGTRQAADRIGMFINQWEHLFDELGYAPSAGEYADRWDVPEATAHRLYAEFRETFETEDDPGRLLSLLWDGMLQVPSKWLFGVRVVEEFQSRH